MLAESSMTLDMLNLRRNSWAVLTYTSPQSAGARGGRVAGPTEAEFETEAPRC